jgi:exopolysaccharide production protein ExoZ
MHDTTTRSQTRRTGSQNEIIGVQAMRFTAALSVVVDHYVIHLCEQGVFPQSWLPFSYRLGSLGVFLFFAISGFVMVLSNRNKFQVWRSSIDFVIRRIIRIWPMYFLATILVVAIKHSDPLNSIQNILKSLAFVPYISEVGLYRPVLGKGWTLNYEMFFYAVFAVCLNFPRNRGLLRPVRYWSGWPSVVPQAITFSGSSTPTASSCSSLSAWRSATQ